MAVAFFILVKGVLEIVFFIINLIARILHEIGVTH